MNTSRMRMVMAAAVMAGLCTGLARGITIQSAGTGYWTNPATWSPVQVPAITDDATIANGHTVTINTNESLSIGSLTIQSGGVLTHLANGITAQGERFKAVLNITNFLTIDSGGQINADGAGYSALEGPGKGLTGSTGGGYGGRGAVYELNGNYIAGPTYGAITTPTNCGSGGHYTAGGGAVQVVVGGTTTVNGLISASGLAASYYTGSGGSIFLTTGALAGSGTLRAKGGDATGSYGSGGGGRIAVVLTNSTDFGGVKMQAYAGNGGGRNGSGGTVYLQHANHTAGQGILIMDHNNLVPMDTRLGWAFQNGQTASSYAFSEIVLTNAGVLALDSNDTLNVAGTTFRGDLANRNSGIFINGGTLTIPSAFAFSNFFITIATTNTAFQPTASLLVGPNATLRIDVPWALDCPLTLQEGGWLTHSANGSTEAYKLNLAIRGNLDVLTGAQVNVDAMGYAGGRGPGANAGGSYGGKGGRLYNPAPAATYGSLTAPTNLGSGGAFSGGGAVRLAVTGTSTVDGVISSGGAGGDGYGGSGGSIYLTTAALTGSGTLRAIGGTGIAGWSSGGGGRIAVVLTNSTDFGAVKMLAYTASSGAYLGAGGTIYQETVLQGPGKGTLLIDGGNITPDPVSSTLISSNVTDTVVGTVVITNKGVFQIDTNQSLTVNGSWINKATFVAITNSTVRFTGTNTATILGHNTYHNLVCTNAGKTLLFEDGKTNTVEGTLTLANATVDSTSGSATWYLKASANTHSVSNVTAGRSDARPGATIEARDSTDQGDNYNWVFVNSGFATNIWTGETDTDWFKASNWSLNRTTIFTDSVLIPGSCVNYPLLNFDKRLRALAIGSGASLGMNGYSLTVDEGLSVTGTLTAVGTTSLTVGGNLDFSGGGVFNAANSTMWIIGANTQTVVSAGNAFCNLTISNSAAPVVFADAVVAGAIVNLSRPITFGGSVTVTSAFRTQGTNVIFGGAVTAPAFDNRNGALVFSGVVSTVTFTNWQGDLTFRDDVSSRDFYCAPGGMALTFNAGKTCTIGNLELYGRSGYPIQMRSSAGSSWYLNVTNRATVRLVDVQYSDASAGQTIRPVASTDSGGNPNWVFGGPWQTWVGGVSGSFTNGSNWSPAGAPGESSHLLVDGYSATAPVLSGVATVAMVMVGGNITTATLRVNGNLTTLEDVEVMPNGTITHSANSDSEAYKLQLTVGNNLLLHGAINVDGMGYAGGRGPGASAGGSYGGKGGRLYNPGPAATYGSLTAPTNLGSGGAFSGGGAVRLTVAGTSSVNGVISAIGGSGDGYGGSGGSIYLTTAALTGSGTLRVIGGTGIAGWSSGGGGRMAVVLTNSTDFGAVKMLAYTPSIGAYKGAGGTIYQETVLQGPGKGTLLIDAGNITPDPVSSTLISSNVTDTVVGTVIITNQAVFQIDTNQSLTVNGSWINKAAFAAMTNSTVNFAGADAATICADNTFVNLTCTNAGKTLSFEAGKTNTVNGLLNLGSMGLTMVTLQSTTPGSQWYLTLTTGVGTQQIGKVSVKDSNAGGGQELKAAKGSVNGGNNANWFFPKMAGTVIMVW